jgi:hypothetical protein
MDGNGAEPRDEDLRQMLLAMAAADQALRTELAADGSLFSAYHPRMAALHRQHAQRLLAILETQGWPTTSVVGEDGAEAAWLIVQHAIGSAAVMRQGLAFLSQPQSGVRPSGGEWPSWTTGSGSWKGGRSGTAPSTTGMTAANSAPSRLKTPLESMPAATPSGSSR